MKLSCKIKSKDVDKSSNVLKNA